MLVIGIAGGSGSGKTTVVNRIIERIGRNNLSIISQDSYYYDNSNIPLEERKKINFDHPNAIEFSLLIDHLRQLRCGQPIEEPTYSYLTCTRGEETIHVEPKDVVIVEGILVLTNPELRDLMDIKVFVDADGDDRLSRIILRDMVERGRTAEMALNHYSTTVKPMHLQFIEPSKRFADLIIPQGGHNEKAIDVLTHYIQQQISQGSCKNQ
ncbi:MAG: uridine kinase [Bacteroidales bacterium]|nr:uridine kinase [Bacteroidales bacterium]